MQYNILQYVFLFVVIVPVFDSHHIFLEPETREGKSIYPNGISSSVPKDVQDSFIHSIPGLEKVKILMRFLPQKWTKPNLQME